MSMFRMKSVFTVLAVAVSVCVVPMAFATSGPSHVVIAGSSALWQTMGLGAYSGGNCPATGAVKPCFHWTGGKAGGGQINLRDNRGGINNLDAATLWVVWDSNTTGGQIPDTWIFAKVDSVVGDRCFFANPACQLVDSSVSNADWSAAGAGSISSSLWGSDTTIPSSPFTGGNESLLQFFEDSVNVVVNAAGTDIRPEDAQWAILRVNSQHGASALGGSNSDGLDGLGYNANYNPGEGPNEPGTTCTALGANSTNAVGTPIYSAYNTTGVSSDAANVVSFNISGKDPITCSTIATPTVYTVGVSPIVFVHGRENNLAGLQNASEAQLQQVFSGTNVDASAFGLAEGSIDAYLREPLSGTYNTTEATVMRYPTLYSSTGSGAPVMGLSMETGVGNPTAGSTSNPLNLAGAAGAGFRYRGVGTGDVINEVEYSTDGKSGVFPNSNHVDGIAYTFFSYGNVSGISDKTAFGYLTLNGVDPIFRSHVKPPVDPDPGQPSLEGTLPGTTETTFPACENTIWFDGLSFPNVRNGQYRAWSALRLIANSTSSTPIKNLVAASNSFVVTSVPDYITFTKQTIAAGGCGTAAFVDPGFFLVRSHYQQLDGSNPPILLGSAPVNTGTDKGGDMGGQILILESSGFTPADSTNYRVQGGASDGTLGNYVRPKE